MLKIDHRQVAFVGRIEGRPLQEKVRERHSGLSHRAGL